MEDSVKECSQTTKDIHVDSLIPNPDNVNEMDEDSLKILCDNISEAGFNTMITVVPGADGKYLIMDGHQRWRAAKRLGMSYLPAIVQTDVKWQDSDLFDLQSFRLNNIKGTSNTSQYVKFHDRMAKKYGAESVMQVLAITDKSNAKKLARMVKSSLKDSGVSEEVLKQVDEAGKKSKDLNQFTKYMNKVFADQANNSMRGCILFSSGSQEHMVVHANDGLFNAMKAISSFATSQNKNVNEYLEPVLIELLAKLK